MTKEETIKIIKDAKKTLPKDYLRIVFNRLKAKGFVFTKSQISYGINNPNMVCDPVILEEFVSYVEEIKTRQTEAFKRLKETVEA